MSIPPGTDLSRVPGLQPPPGVVPNFVNPESRAHATIVGNGVATGIMMVFVITRMYTKLFISKAFGWEDCTQTLLSILCLKISAHDVHVDACAIAAAMALGYMGMIVYGRFNGSHKAFIQLKLLVLNTGLGAHQWDIPVTVLLNEATIKVVDTTTERWMTPLTVNSVSERSTISMAPLWSLPSSASSSSTSSYFMSTE